MGTWCLIDPGVFLIFFVTPPCSAAFFFFLGAFIRWCNLFCRTAPLGQPFGPDKLKFCLLDLVQVFLIFCGGFLHCSLIITFPPPGIAPLLAPYKYRGVGVGGTC